MLIAVLSKAINVLSRRRINDVAIKHTQYVDLLEF
jgi:hypothetical protein